MNLFIEMKPTMYRWFTPAQMDEPYLRLAFTDVVRFIIDNAIGIDSEIDIIGSSSYLISSGIATDTVNKFIQVASANVRFTYFNNTSPDWRSWGRHSINVDADYNVFIQLGIDPYV